MNLNCYTAFDVELANPQRNSVCSIGVVRVENNEIVFSKEFLINPECEFSFHNIRIHNITPEMVKNKPIFPEVWKEIKPFFENTLLIAHNAKSMDLCAMYRMLEKYELPIPDFQYVCTLELARNLIPQSECGSCKLNLLCDALNIQFEHHHNALDDALACRSLFEILKGRANENVFVQGYFGPESSASNKIYHAGKPLYNKKTQAMQELHDIVTAVLADRVVSQKEANELLAWMEHHHELEGYYPYDKIFETIRTILLDNIISETEEETLLTILDAFAAPEFTDKKAEGADDFWNGKLVCLSGEFSFGSKKEVESFLAAKGATVSPSVTKKLNVLILGQGGSDAWKYGNYGSKYEKAKQLNEKGCSIEIYKEKDVLGE